MENVRLNVEYDLLLQKTKFCCGFKGNENKKIMLYYDLLIMLIL
jgi:hypothetical protein